jgi:hypothetical protein
MQESETVMYKSIHSPKLLTKNLTNWGTMDVVLLLVIFVLVIISWVFVHVFMAVLVIIVLVPLLIRFPKSYGRFYQEAIVEIRGLYIDKVLGGVIQTDKFEPSSIVRWLRSRRIAFPLKLTTIEAEVEKKIERSCIIQQIDRPYDHIFIAADGGGFGGLDINQQTYAINELASVTNTVITQSKLKVGISYVRMTSPYDGSQISSYLATAMNPVIAYPERFDIDDRLQKFVSWQQKNASQLRDTATKFGAASTWYLIVVTIKRSPEMNSAMQGKALKSKQLYELPIIELGRSFLTALKSSPSLKLKNVRILGLPELSQMARSGWDVTDINEFYKDRADGKIPTTDADIEAIKTRYGAKHVDHFLQTWMKHKIVVSKEDMYIQFDNNFVSTLRITNLPSQARSDQFMGLHFKPRPGRWTRLVMAGESVSGNTETDQLIYKASAIANFERAFKENRIIQDPRSARRQR